MMEIESIDDFGYAALSSVSSASNWNGRSVEQWGEERPQVMLACACSRIPPTDLEIDGYIGHGKEGTSVGGRVSLKMKLGGEDSEKDKRPERDRENDSRERLDASPPDVDTRDRDFDRW